MAKLGDAVKGFEDGDYSTRVHAGGSKEIRDLEFAFNHMAEEIQTQILLKEQSEKNRKKLILDISHDLKNPLSSIMGYAELNIKEQNNEYAKIIYDNSIRAKELVDDLFELSKLESPDFQLNLNSVDFTEFFREEIISMLPELEAKGINYELDIPDEKIILSIDERRMRRVISNLLYNVITYHDKKGNVQIILEKEEISIGIVFSNYMKNGLKDKEKLFEPFVRSELNSDTNTINSGLGLSIVKKIISMHNGTVYLGEASDEIFKVVIDLPRI